MMIGAWGLQISLHKLNVLAGLFLLSLTFILHRVLPYPEPSFWPTITSFFQVLAEAHSLLFFRLIHL